MITMKTEGDKFIVASPYNPAFSPKAKALGGRWDAQRKVWGFDPRNEAAVKAMVAEVYGFTSAEEPGVTVKVALLPRSGAAWPRETEIYLGGRQVARVFGRDSGNASLGEGVTLLAGEIFSGGSAKNPSLVVKEGTVLLLRDIPPGKVEAIRASSWVDTAEVVSETPSEKEKLLARLQTLRAEVASLEAALAELEAQGS